MRKDLVTGLDSRLRDEIDDRVAEAFDAYLADRLAEPGPLRAAVTGPRRVWVVVLTIALGVLVTLLAPVGAAVGCGIWLAIAVTNIVLLTARRGS